MENKKKKNTDEIFVHGKTNVGWVIVLVLRGNIKYHFCNY